LPPRLTGKSSSQTSHNLDCFWGSLCYILRTLFHLHCLTQRSSPVWRGSCGGRGQIVHISKIDHHNINGGAVSTVHDVTGRRLVISI
jgi:hypothetical protein